MNAPLLIGGYGHVYVLSLEGGIVKVGKSARPKERIKSHGAGIGRFRRIEDHWISPSHLNYHENERALIEFLGVGGEVGEGDYAAVVEFASSLHFKVETQAEYQERRAHEQAAFEKMMSAFTSRCLGVKENEEPHMLMYLHAARTVRFVLESSGSG